MVYHLNKVMITPSQSSFLKECPKGSSRVCLSNRITAGLPLTTSSLSSSTSLPYRLENIVAFRVLYLNVSCANAELPKGSGYLVTLLSNKLGSKISSNPFSIGATTDSTSSIASVVSSVIGMTAYVGESTNNHGPFPFESCNQKMYFTSPQSIDTFDWSIVPVNGSFTLASACAVEAIIEFYPLCKC